MSPNVNDVPGPFGRLSKLIDCGVRTVTVEGAGPSAPKSTPRVPLALVAAPVSLPVPYGSVAGVRPPSSTLPEAAPAITGTSSVSETVKAPLVVSPSKSRAVKLKVKLRLSSPAIDWSSGWSSTNV